MSCSVYLKTSNNIYIYKKLYFTVHYTTNSTIRLGFATTQNFTGRDFDRENYQNLMGIMGLEIHFNSCVRFCH